MPVLPALQLGQACADSAQSVGGVRRASTTAPPLLAIARSRIVHLAARKSCAPKDGGSGLVDALEDGCEQHLWQWELRDQKVGLLCSQMHTGHLLWSAVTMMHAPENPAGLERSLQRQCSQRIRGKLFLLSLPRRVGLPVSDRPAGASQGHAPGRAASQAAGEPGAGAAQRRGRSGASVEGARGRAGLCQAWQGPGCVAEGQGGSWLAGGGVAPTSAEEQLPLAPAGSQLGPHAWCRPWQRWRRSRRQSSTQQLTRPRPRKLPAPPRGGRLLKSRHA